MSELYTPIFDLPRMSGETTNAPSLASATSASVPAASAATGVETRVTLQGNASGAQWMLSAPILTLQNYMVLGPYFYTHPMPAYLAITRRSIYGTPNITSVAIGALAAARVQVSKGCGVGWEVWTFGPGVGDARGGQLAWDGMPDLMGDE